MPSDTYETAHSQAIVAQAQGDRQLVLRGLLPMAFLHSAQAEQAAASAGGGGGRRGTRRKTEGGAEGEDEDTPGGSRLLSLVDYRLRVLEGKLPTFFLKHDDSFILPALQAANKLYDDKKLAKGKAHPLGARRCTYAAAFLNCIVTAKLDEGDWLLKIQAAILAHDTYAGFVGVPTIAKQKECLTGLLRTFSTAEMMGAEVSACTFIKCKKPDANGKARYLFGLEIDHMSALRYCVDFMKITLEGVGAVRVDGPPPMGPLVRALPKGRA